MQVPVFIRDNRQAVADGRARRGALENPAFFSSSAKMPDEAGIRIWRALAFFVDQFRADVALLIGIDAIEKKFFLRSAALLRAVANIDQAVVVNRRRQQLCTPL